MPPRFDAATPLFRQLPSPLPFRFFAIAFALRCHDISRLMLRHAERYARRDAAHYMRVAKRRRRHDAQLRAPLHDACCCAIWQAREARAITGDAMVSRAPRRSAPRAFRVVYRHARDERCLRRYMRAIFLCRAYSALCGLMLATMLIRFSFYAHDDYFIFCCRYASLMFCHYADADATLELTLPLRFIRLTSSPDASIRLLISPRQLAAPLAMLRAAMPLFDYAISCRRFRFSSRYARRYAELFAASPADAAMLLFTTRCCQA